MTNHTSIGPFRYHIPDSAPFYETRMSLLWLAEALDANRRPLGEKVVLKVARLKEEQFSLANQRAIDNEERWLRRLSHPGIVKLRPIAEEGNVRPGPTIFRARSTLPGSPWFVVTDYLPGDTLQSLVQERKKLETPLALAIMHSLAVTLAYCHRQGCVHRDFKPQNVLFAEAPMTSRLSAKSQPILIDFGIANAVGEQQVIAGSFPWLPPESDQALRAGMKLAAAPSMDIYAWGLTLYFIMTGIRPPAPTVQPTQLLIAAHTLTDLPVQRRAKVAAALNQLIQQSVATDPAARPNAQQLAAALEQLQQLLPAPIFAPLWQRSALAKVLTTGMVGRLFSQRWAWAGGAVVAALLGLAIIYAPGRTPKPAPTPVALAVQAATATTIGLTLATSTATVAPATVTATAPPATPTPVLLIATAPGASSAAASTAAVINTAVSTVDTPAATPTVITSPTRAPTSTPIPTATVTPTAPDTPTPIATATRPVARENPTTSVSAANPTLVLLEPLVDVLSGRQTFRWQTDVVLAQNQAFELILWAVGADPLANGFGPFGVTTATAVTGDLEAFVNATGSQYLANGRDYLWGVRLVERDPYRPLQYLGGAHRFRFQTNNRDDSPLRSPERAPAEKSASGP